MPTCRQCGKQWPDGYAVCPDDGMRMSVMSGTAIAETGALAVATAASSDDELAPGSAAGEYIIERKIGEGGMGAVYGARHPVIGKRAAVKVIKRELSASAEAVDRFVLEAQAVNTIGHPNIVDVFGFGQLPDGRSFFVMEWLEGESLRDRMQRPLSFSQALEVLESIAIALQAAHEAGVVHRDLKPDNVYLQRTKGSPAPRVKLLDFGLAKLQGAGAEGGMHHTRTGVVMGTPLYLSPEQAKGAKVDLATDVYSLGAMAYEMGAGVVPFMADSAVEIMAMHISAQPEPLGQRAPWIPPSFEQLVRRMLEKDPRNRPPAAEVVQELQRMRSEPAVANAAPTGASPASWTPAPDLRRTPAPPAASLAPSVAASLAPPTTSMAPSVAASMAPPTSSKRGLVIGIVAVLVLAAGGVAAFAMMGTDKKHTAAQPMSTVPAPAQPAPAGSAAVATTEPVKPEPVTTEPAKPEPAKPEPAKPEPAKPEPTKTEPGKPAHPHLGTVVLAISGAPRGTVFVDGKQVAADVADLSLELAPGEHKIRVQAPGHKPFEESIRVESGAKKSVSVVLKKKSINTVHDPFAD